jgi:succinate dehydrogenase / fumarate reductase, cytochrome b subunit
MSSLMLTLRESVRYRGRSGHWSWVAHRLSGLAILSFLVIHVWDTANATYAPDVYRWSVEVFKHPLFGLGEVGLVGAVLYHAFNGIRISLLDFKPEWWKYQQKSAMISWGLFLIVFIPIAIMMISGIISHCSHGASCWVFPRLSDFTS